MKRITKFISFMLAAVVAMTAMCVSAGAINAPKLTAASLTLDVGKTHQLYVNYAVESISWSTSNSKVATVSKGKVTAKAAGTATITAKHGSKALKCTVTVKKKTGTAYKANSFDTAIPIKIGESIDNKDRMTAGQEHVYYKFTTSTAGDYKISLSHPKDYFGTADAIFKLSDSSKKAVSKDEWFRGETSGTYTLKGNSVYYLETWDYVIFTVSKVKSTANYKGDSFDTAIPIDIGDTIDNKAKMTAGQEHVYYKFTTGAAGTYTITLSHPKDYFGTADAIFKISDSSKNAVSKDEWFRGETSKSYTLKANSVYYLETWDYVIFKIK